MTPAFRLEMAAGHAAARRHGPRPGSRRPGGTHGLVLDLQRLAGNQAVTSLVRTGEGHFGNVVQRDIAASTKTWHSTYEGNDPDNSTITADAPADGLNLKKAFADLIAAKKIQVIASGERLIFSPTGVTVAEATAALTQAGFENAPQMAAGLMKQNDIYIYQSETDTSDKSDEIIRKEKFWLDESRALTGYERDQAVSVFWGAIDLDPVVISEGGALTVGGYARTTPDRIRFPSDSYHRSDFIPWLIHELTHVWQYQHGYAASSVIVSGIRGNYNYGGQDALRKRWADGDNFDSFGTEQQGDIMENYYEERAAGHDVSAFEPWIAQVRSGVTDQRLPPAQTVVPLPSGTFDVTAANEEYRKKTELEIIGQLGLTVAANDNKRILARQDRVLQLFRKLTFWGAQYIERIKNNNSGDTLANLLHRRMSEATVHRVLKIMGGGG
jgi:hypothetical protein